MKIKHRRSLTSGITAIAVVPTIILGLIISVYSAINSYSIAYYEIKHELESVSLSIYEFFDEAHPGEFDASEDQLKKGGSELDCFYDTVNTIKGQTGIDITLFTVPQDVSPPFPMRMAAALWARRHRRKLLKECLSMEKSIFPIT